MFRCIALGTLVVLTTLGLPSNRSAAAEPRPENSQVAYRTVRVDGVDIFYREAGPNDAPAILLLHGFPSSSFMFRDLILRLFAPAPRCGLLALSIESSVYHSVT